MILTTDAPDHHSSSLTRFVSTTALIVALSLSGCVKSPRDILASWRGQTNDVEEASVDSEAIADSTAGDDSTSTVSTSKAEPGVPQQEFGAENLLDRLLSQKDSNDSATTDPFVGIDAAEDADRERSDKVVSNSASEVRRRAATLEELLAQTKPKSDRDSKEAVREGTPVAKLDQHKHNTDSVGDVNRFASEFDSRLDQLKADLASEAELANSTAKDDVNPFAEFVASRESQVARVSSVSHQTTSQPISEIELPASRRHPLSDSPRTAKERVRHLLNQAHDDWESWRLKEAYRKALAAQELAVLEGVEFEVSDERPSDLAKRIASDIRQDSLTTSTSSSNAKSWTDEGISEDRSFGEVASRTFESFAAGTPNVGWQAVSLQPSLSVETSQTARAPGFDSTDSDSIPAASGGVNLMPPADDDFPSEAEGNGWNIPASTGMSTSNNQGNAHREIVNLAWPETTAAPTETVSPRQEFEEGPTLVRYETDTNDRAIVRDHESTNDLMAHVAANRERVLQFDGPSLPALPAPETSSLVRGKSEPDQVASATPILLGVNDRPASSIAVASPRQAVPAVTTDRSTASLWYSRPLWFVGGLVLLMLSMRLLSRRSLPSA